MEKEVGDEELVPLDKDMPEDLQELSPSCICECSRSVCRASRTASAARHTRMRHSACTSAAFADNGKWRNPQCKKHADGCGRWVNGSIITTIGTTGVDAAGRLPERQNL